MAAEIKVLSRKETAIYIYVKNLLKVLKMSKKTYNFKQRRVFEEWRRCTSGKPGHFYSGKPKHL